MSSNHFPSEVDEQRRALLLGLMTVHADIINADSLNFIRA